MVVNLTFCNQVMNFCIKLHLFPIWWSSSDWFEHCKNFIIYSYTVNVVSILQLTIWNIRLTQKPLFYVFGNFHLFMCLWHKIYNGAYTYYNRGDLTFCCVAPKELKIQISNEEIYNLDNLSLNWVPNEQKNNGVCFSVCPSLFDFCLGVTF